jgi:hypothetical protein
MAASGVDLDKVKAELSPMCGGKCTTAALKDMGLRSPPRPSRSLFHDARQVMK